MIATELLRNQVMGDNTYSRKVKGLEKGGVYFITISTRSEKATQKIIIED